VRKVPIRCEFVGVNVDDVGDRLDDHGFDVVSAVPLIISVKFRASLDWESIQNDTPFGTQRCPSTGYSVSTLTARQERHLDLDVVHEARLNITQVIDNVFRDVRECNIASARSDGGDSPNVGSRRSAMTTSGSASNVHDASLNRTN
jgi:hypothetical protein